MGGLENAPMGPGELEEEIPDPDSNLEDMPADSNLEVGSNLSNCCKEALAPTGLPSWHHSCLISSRRFFISALYSDTRNFLPENQNEHGGEKKVKHSCVRAFTLIWCQLLKRRFDYKWKSRNTYHRQCKFSLVEVDTWCFLSQLC